MAHGDDASSSVGPPLMGRERGVMVVCLLRGLCWGQSGGFPVDLPSYGGRSVSRWAVGFDAGEEVDGPVLGYRFDPVVVGEGFEAGAEVV